MPLRHLYCLLLALSLGLALGGCRQNDCLPDSCNGCDGKAIPAPFPDLSVPKRVAFDFSDALPTGKCDTCANELYSIELYRTEVYYFAGGVPAFNIYYRDSLGQFYWVAVSTADEQARPTALEWFWQLTPETNPPTLIPMRWYWGPGQFSYLMPPRLPVGITVRVHRWIRYESCPNFGNAKPNQTVLAVGVQTSGAIDPIMTWHDTLSTPTLAPNTQVEFYADYTFRQAGAYVMSILVDAFDVIPEVDSANNFYQTTSAHWMAYDKNHPQSGLRIVDSAHGAPTSGPAVQLVGWGFEGKKH